ncbi:MAG: TMEM43 family protein [Planctomycetota bacterium]
MDSFTETTSEGWGSRIMDSIKGVLVGIVLFLVSFPLLFWNEGRYINTKKALEEGAGMVVEVKPDKVDAANKGKLVCTSGKADTQDVLSDPAFPSVSINAIRLKRTAQMYQWDQEEKSEKKKKLGGGTTTTTTYSYKKVWSEKAIDSSRFKVPKDHENPGNMEVQSDQWAAKDVKLGAFTLTSDQIRGFSNFQALDPSKNGTPAAAGGEKPAEDKKTEDEKAPAADPLTCPECGKKLKSEKGVEDHAKAVHKKSLAELREAAAKKQAEAQGAEATASGGNAPAGFKPMPGGGLYKGKDPSKPEVGDLKIEWEFAPAADVTVLGGQTDGGTIGGFKTSNGTEISDFRMGLMTAAQLFEKKQGENVMLTWILRFIGFFLMGIGLSMVFKPIAVVADVIPFLGDLVGLGFGLAAFGIAACLSLLTIAVGWLFYRPLIGIPLVLLGIGVIVGLFMMAKGKKAGGAAPAAPAPAAG